jgi:hypothetical protein
VSNCKSVHGSSWTAAPAEENKEEGKGGEKKRKKSQKIPFKKLDMLPQSLKKKERERQLYSES